jgi:hypothetical protein
MIDFKTAPSTAASAKYQTVLQRTGLLATELTDLERQGNERVEQMGELV